MASSHILTKHVCRWRRRKEARPGEILEAALDLFVKKGFAATKLSEVASAAGVSKGTVYLYFDSKVALFQALVQEMMLPHIEIAEKRVTAYQGPTADLMHGLVEFWIDDVINTRVCGIPKLIISEAKNFPELARFYVDKVVNRGMALVERIIQRGIDRKEFVVDDISYTARAVLTPLVFSAIWEHSLRPFDRKDYDVRKYLQAHMNVVLHGLEARGKSR